jgi:hypothetical protein
MPGEGQTLSAHNLGPKAFSVKLSPAAFLDINVGIFAVFFPIEISEKIFWHLVYHKGIK